MSEITEAVRQRYAQAATQLPQACGCDCCSGPYEASDLKDIGLSDALSLGCGNPTALAELKPGEVVLDLGSGAGLDVLLSARRVGPAGRSYGVDMTDEMLALANKNRDKAGIGNATFLKGTIDTVPLPDESVDVVISNCVINLAEDKEAVIKEAYRVLRPGGRFAVADMVALDPVDPEMKKRLDAWVGCIAGSIPVEDYRAHLTEAGFVDAEFEVHSTQKLEGAGEVGSAYIRARKPA